MTENSLLNQTINIVLTSSEYYVPYTYVLMYSIIKNTKANLCFYILSNDITEKSKLILNTLNTEIKYISVDTKNYPVPRQKRANAIVYSKLFLPKICPELEKALVLDSDIIVDCDVAEIYNTNIKNLYVAWVEDPIDVNGLSADFVKKINLKYPYINSGVLLLNLKEYTKDDIMGKIWSTYESYKDKIAFFDQDLLYILLSKKCKFLDTKYNYLPTLKYQKPGINDYCNLHYKVLHYGTDRKPWLNPSSDLASVWWQYARQTPFYEEILARFIDTRVRQICNVSPQPLTTQLIDTRVRQICNVNPQPLNTHLPVLLHPIRFKFKKFIYKLKKNFGSKKHRAKYRDKYNAIKTRIKATREFQKKLK